MKKAIILITIILMLPILSATFMMRLLSENHISSSNYPESGNNEAYFDAYIEDYGETPAKRASADNNKAFNCLIAGFDNVAENTDVLILVSYNEIENRITFMQIPRDTYVCFNGENKKINSLFSHYLGNGRDKSTALGKLSEFVSDNFGIPIDCYAAVTISQLSDMVDAVGGVTVDVPFDMKYDDDEQNLHIDIKAGTQTLNGKKALEFVRFRKSYIRGDLGRLDAQKIFINALMSKLMTDKTHDKIKIAAIIAKDINTNASVTDIFRMYSAAKNNGVSIISFTVPGDAAKDPKGGEWYYIINKKTAENAIYSYINNGRTIEFDKNRVFICNDNDAFSDIYNNGSFELKTYSENDVPKITIKCGG